MSYSRTKKLTTNDKRLQALKTQLYGKDKELGFQFTAISNNTNTHTSPMPSENIYFQKDLLKTLILASLIIAVQLFLYSATSKGLINLSW